LEKEWVLNKVWNKVTVMGLLNRIPGLGAGKGFVYAAAKPVIEGQYKRARQNFTVFADGIRRKVVVPAVMRKCERFYFDNRKEAEFAEEFQERLNMVFRAGKEEVFAEEDADWIDEELVPYLVSRERFVKLKLMKLMR